MQSSNDKSSEVGDVDTDKPYLNESTTDQPPQITSPEAPEQSLSQPLQQQLPVLSQQSQQAQQQHATWQHQQHPRHMLNKFATIHSGDKYHQDLRRDVLTNFDRNLTVETAHFDPQLHSSAGPTSSSSSPAVVRRGPMSYSSGLGSNSSLVSGSPL
ncbi:hypothetical protein K450DRAFT_225309 [Umbelopsis ramanniana AG]|uniref:Uncharacterized protein n=1 Tax=Umbelopsis ramanniana AG TaxID=1314678 RepID=A0AAD5HHP7_UMBRA|nr:uncharacterized protein K450DRAFT_225309 [Umbelopsis ramanniana AG]KAI8582886.1 hypothetical protein K450DRAFT_225309 [Umbelopsis ramanniana AG]